MPSTRSRPYLGASGRVGPDRRGVVVGRACDQAQADSSADAARLTVLVLGPRSEMWNGWDTGGCWRSHSRGGIATPRPTSLQAAPSTLPRVRSAPGCQSKIVKARTVPIIKVAAPRKSVRSRSHSAPPPDAPSIRDPRLTPDRGRRARVLVGTQNRSSLRKRVPPGRDRVLRRPLRDADDAGGAGAGEVRPRGHRWRRRSRPGWANLGLLLLRQQELDRARSNWRGPPRSRPRAPQIQRLQALAESRRGNLAEAIAPLAARAGAGPGRSRGRLRARARNRAAGRHRERRRGAAHSRRSSSRGRENLAARLEYVRLAAKRGDQAALQRGDRVRWPRRRGRGRRRRRSS